MNRIGKIESAKDHLPIQLGFLAAAVLLLNINFDLIGVPTVPIPYFNTVFDILLLIIAVNGFFAWRRCSTCMKIDLPPGSGKSLPVAFLLSKDAMVVNDPKGEIYRDSARLASLGKGPNHG